MVTRTLLLLVLAGGCAESRFGEGPEIPDECAGSGTEAITPRDQLLELGRLQGGAFVPLVGGETLELDLSGAPYGWSFEAAVRFQVFSGSAMPSQCLPATAIRDPGGPIGLAFSARWADEGNGTGRWVSASPMLIPVGEDLEALLGGPPIVIQVAAGLYDPSRYTSGTPPMTFTYVNREGFLAP